ncbi:Fe-S-containing hydro-lyase [Cytobacillus sp. FJAT-54145]|uniref:Fe-S-containing hydro-lyase n=1 Tax=Cytobacillus spartinae TaxID=3299023 RepID=A0ABW6KBD3_9BACI
MSTIKKITTPLTDEVVRDLKAGDQVSISGVIYTARDAAHKLLTESIKAGEELPVDFTNQVVYYAGPTPAKPGKVIGSCGPTTSGRMDAYSPMMMEQGGLKGMIGKGPRSKEVVEAMKANNVVYFAAIGGAAALIADSVKEADVVAFDELGPEAIRRLVVEDYPCIVAIDSEGNNLYELGVQQYRVVD